MFSQYPTSSYDPSLISYTVPSQPTSQPNENTYNILQNWLHSRPSLSLRPASQRFASDISIPVYKQLRRHCNDLITETNKQIIGLENALQTLPQEVWCEKKDEIDCKIGKINEIANIISHPKVTKGIQQRINRGKRKRAKCSRGKYEMIDSIGVIRGDIGASGSKSSSSRILEIENVDTLLSSIVKLRNLRRLATESVYDDSSIFEEKVQDFQDTLSKQKETILNESQRTDST